MIVLVERVLFVIAALLYLYWLYQMTIAVQGFRVPAAPPRASKAHRFAVLVPARNEELVIGNLLDSLALQDYPKDAFHVYVACDGCTDATPTIGQEKGARMLRRDDVGPPGKTANLRWAISQISLDDYDALVVFDADNVVHPKFLARMSDQLAAYPRAEAFQGYLDVKNPDDSWVTRVYALSFWYANRFWQQARQNAGLSVNLGGTGEVIRESLLRRLGWRWSSLTDDLELTCEIVLAGGRVHYVWNAVLYDEKPVDLRASRAQRTRWLHGHYWAFRRYFGRLLAATIRRRKLAALDLALHLAIPGRAAMSSSTMFGGFIVVLARSAIHPGWPNDDPQAWIWWLFPIAAAIQCVLVLIIAPSLHHHRVTLRYLRDLGSFFWYGMRWLPTLVRTVLVPAHQRDWNQTAHARAIPIGDVADRHDRA
jgi:cellulose synthase/poly-beta-1,6-N-acetylglucosamine synthase-like glycosyltransferase